MAAAHECSAAAAGEAPTTGEHRMGTTIVGVCYDGGVILGADSRTSTGTGFDRSPLDLSAPREILPPVRVDMARRGSRFSLDRQELTDEVAGCDTCCLSTFTARFIVSFLLRY